MPKTKKIKKIKREREYKIMEGNSLSPFYYLYIRYYANGRMLGNILSGLIIAASVIIGLITKNIIIDSVVYSIAFGSFTYNYAMIRALSRGQKTGYFNEGEKFEYFDSLKKALPPMVILSRFFEIYTPFILAVIMPNLVLKVVAGVLFTGFIVFYKVSNNFVENKVTSIIKKNSLYQLVAVVLGVLLSMQTIVTVRVYDNVVFLFLGIIIGLLKYAMNKNIRDFFIEQKKASTDKTSEIDIYMLKDIFFLTIRKLGEPTPEERKEAHRRYLEEEKRKKEEEEKREEEHYKRSMELKRELDRQSERDKKLVEEWRENGRKEKERKKLEEKLLRGDAKLSDEEMLRKKELQSKNSEVKIEEGMSNDRASIRR